MRKENKGYKVDSLFGKPPARRIRPSKCKNIGVHSSRKNGRGAESESGLEHDFLTLLEFDDRVEQYNVQPVTLRWAVNGKQLIYTPDVMVKYTDAARSIDKSLKPTLYEVKPYSVLKKKWQEFRPKFRKAVSWIKEHDGLFRIITEKEIQTTFLNNVKFLSRYHCSTFVQVADEEREENYVLRSLHQTGEVTVNELLAYMSVIRLRQAELIPWIWRLILEKKICVDMDKPLTMASRIRLNGGGPR